uniref:Disease resistance N-terminal domain-containing protein n=1 Tax=Populus trichocarpa TaxID=3694 RepID=A0A2K1Z4Q0_POPTR
MADQVLSPNLQKCLVVFGDSRTTLKKDEAILVNDLIILEDAEEQQVTRKAVKIWLPKLRDAAYVTEDLLEHLTVEGEQYPVPISINA